MEYATELGSILILLHRAAPSSGSTLNRFPKVKRSRRFALNISFFVYHTQPYTNQFQRKVVLLEASAPRRAFSPTAVVLFPMATAATDDDASCPVLNRVEQQRNFGIDCGDEILFAAGAWAPGGEHTKKLHVKNVSNRTLKLKYDLPRTKYFSMEFPVLITLSPGTSRVLDIAFRPVQYEEYDDFIRVLVHIIDGGVKATSGSFRLPVKARISMLHTVIPSAGIDFGFCPTADTTEFKFPLHSTGQIDATFHWTLPGTCSS
ncbi:hypothetical protein B5M09_010359 [Aphanomyces astaci]|uniref:MSP domain-containing protein n=1 Tax=Aphanomyces astaci TaxID=112090 RepID=A0A425CUH5_APHAT|nr:hypothetical protein B5M09_010359 [Aphanomyces astaci]